MWEIPPLIIIIRFSVLSVNLLLLTPDTLHQPEFCHLPSEGSVPRDRLMEGRTVFVIAHRLSTIVNSDVIMVMDHGRIIERGDHDSLMEQGGTYYRLYTGGLEID